MGTGLTSETVLEKSEPFLSAQIPTGRSNVSLTGVSMRHRQRIVRTASAVSSIVSPMPDDTDTLIRRLIGGDERAAAEILDAARTTTSPTLLVAAALLAADPGELLNRAAHLAATTRDRQLVTVAATHLSGAAELLDALVQDHLADHPDNVLVAWIAAHQAAHQAPCPPSPGVRHDPHCHLAHRNDLRSDHVVRRVPAPGRRPLDGDVRRLPARRIRSPNCWSDPSTASVPH